MARDRVDTGARLFLAAVLCGVLALATVACCNTDQQKAAPPVEGQGSAPTRGGMKAYVDPETGELTDQPPPGAEIDEGDVRTPPATAVERPAPGGGVLLDLHPDDK